MEPVYHFEIIVPAEAVDGNRHVNNVAYVQWMQDAALAHSAATGCTRMTEALGATWVARMHRIEYLSPGFAGEAITVLTWVADFRKVRSLRRYKIIRAADQKVLAEGSHSRAADSQGCCGQIHPYARHHGQLRCTHHGWS